MAGPSKRQESADEARESAAQFDGILAPGERHTDEYNSYLDELQGRRKNFEDLRLQYDELKAQREAEGADALDFGTDREFQDLRKAVEKAEKDYYALEKRGFQGGAKYEQTGSADEKPLILSFEEITRDLMLNSDPRLVAQQQRGVDQLYDIYDKGGFTDAERGQLRQATQQAARYEQAQRGAIEEQMAARGQAGGGAGIAAKLQAQQSGADRAQASADQIGLAGQQRALQSLMSGQQAATQMRGQDDAIKQFNTQFRRNVNQRNTQRKNIMETNEATRDMRNQQRNFQNRMSLAGARSGAGFQGANFLNNQAQQEFQNTMQAIQMGLDVAGQVGGGIAGAG